ncbi:MAG: hypothetical protein P8106_09175 [Gammaproteobacteria bacterium]
MKRTQLLESYPIFALEIGREETSLRDVEAIAAYLRAQIEAEPAATYIATFDHHAHTRGLPDGQIAPEIQAACNVVFCFGLTLPDPQALALRPRSIGIAALPGHFVISFLETPMPVANSAMERWALALRDGAAGDRAH